MRAFFRALRWAGALLAAVAVFGFIPASLGAYGLYWKRYATTFLTNPLNPAYRWYGTFETVPGDYRQPLPHAADAAARFAPGTLEAAAEYAGAHQSDGLIVMHRGELVLERYWNGKQADSLSAAHSMTKTLNAIMIGHAIADGYIPSVDVPAARFLPEWDTPERRGITIRNLLNMASGLRESFAMLPTSPRMQRIMGTDIVTPNLQAEVGGPPGREFAHVNPDPEILGIIVERASGRRFAEYLAEKFWRPIGAHDAQLYIDHPGGMVHTDCCMWAAIQDWVRVGEALRNGGMADGRQVIPAGWVAEMLKPSAAYANYGMQIWLGTNYEERRYYDPRVKRFYSRHSEPFAAPDVFFLDGLGNQRTYVVPSRALVIVRKGGMDTSWDDARLPNLLIRGLRAS